MKLRPATIFSLFSLLFSLSIAALPALSPYNAPGDILTVIQRPLLNIPAIHIPGETLSITCLAPPSTTGWQAQLIHQGKTVNLPLLSSQYLASPARWELQCSIPQVPVFELYDLRVSASGGILDTTSNAVQLLPTRKTSYYFVHITDLHLPTQIYYPDAGFDSDSTSVNDFRAVLQDINLINPEFVLLTGDLLNEGELEGFAGQYWYGWTQRLLEEFDVPCYVTAGNHDIGGWTDTPPSAGSSRRNWWSYFGWSWLDNPDSNWPLHTQDYDFTYGDLHFLGLESYDNYDNWRSNIYGGQSFIYDQFVWLNARLALQPDKTRVLFHHYDFSDQLNLSSLGVDLALWGHIHSNSGSLTTFPYNLATRSVCNGNRAYRVIRVNDTQVSPQATIYAGYSGTNLSVNYYPGNNAGADSIMAIVTNNQALGFENTRLKFRMPPGNYGYTVVNGVLEQVDRGAQENSCYVRVNLGANSVKYVSIAASATAVDDPLLPALPLISAVYPNPFGDELKIVVDAVSGNSRVQVFNLRGELLRVLTAPSGTEPFVWDGRDGSGRLLPSGLYLLRATNGQRSQLRRVIRF